MDWAAEKTAQGAPMAVLRDGERVVAKVYLSPDAAVLRIALPELELPNDGEPLPASGEVRRGQVKIDFAHKLIDFRRRP